MKAILRICCIFTVLQGVAYAGGTEITVIERAGKSTKGELLALRSDGIILSLQPSASEKILEKYPQLLIYIPKESVADIRIEGHSHVWLGIGVGGAVGLIAGAAIGAASMQEPSGPVGGMLTPVAKGAGAGIGGGIGLLAGALVGGIIGGASSSSDEHFDLADPRNYGALLALARYQGNEPAFMNRVP